MAHNPSEYGEVIDCVDIHKQPAFDHPLLKNHTLEASSIQINRIKRENDDALKALQVWRKNGECPVGTVPIVRTPTSAKYAQKPHLKPHYVSTQPNRSHAFASDGHEYAEAMLFDGPYFGAKADINVWTPVSHGTISVAQIWVVSSPKNYDQLNTVEAGWISDGYRNTGCYNLECPGFIQVSKTVALGAILQPISSYNGKQATINVVLDQHTESGQWWMQFQNEPIGYWPNSIFTSLGNGGETVSWGGEIYNDGAGGHHTETQMGSGHFPNEGFGRASFFSNLQYMDSSKLYKDPEKLNIHVSKPVCYDLLVGQEKVDGKGTYFLFGGPGYSDRCLA
ncbi:protein neprosin-like [Humulus lupulus]|uniref:protein neprosin-like n=1 Tax=Humulus lupulus TaxID=3486 RepID=UPI002B412958|nr:protein neprosin-like [Humulus lupulus]